MVRIFVYGSLKMDHTNNGLLQRAGAQFLGYDSITAHHQMISLGAFPGLVRVPANVGPSTVYGQVWSTNERGLQSVDMLEGHPDWYTRAKVWTDGKGSLKEQKRVWVYYLPEQWEKEADDVVASGMWYPFPKEKNFWKARGVEIEAK